MRKSALLLAAAGLTLLPALGAVRVWQDSLTLPTYDENLPDPNPPFRLLSKDNPVYPYTVRKGMTKKRADHGWRALRIENEYLSCIVLPDLGGRLYSCKDKLSGLEMFHANPVVKKADVGLRGAWVAMGVELNFPVGHTWMAVSPVDFATVQNPDGSGSIWVAGVDRVYQMQWRVEFVLRPGSTILEQNVHLYNGTGSRQPFYWWNNAGVTRVDDKTRFIYPTHLVASHSETEITTWPVNSAGVDMSIVGNHKKDSVAWFAHGCREPFMAVYHPTLRAGVVHYADAKQLPGKKVWSWGNDGDKYVLDALTDLGGKSYVEMQAGMFENQETYGFLDPGESRNFSEYWMPVRALGGVARANLEGVLNLERSADGPGKIQLTVEFEANHKITGAKLRVSNGSNTLLDETADLDPATAFTKTIKGLPAGSHYTFQLSDGAGKVLLSHTEDQYDAMTAKEVKLGPQTPPDRAIEHMTTAADFLKLAEYDESQALTDAARTVYQAGLKRHLDDVNLNRAMGRLAVSKGRFNEAINTFAMALAAAPDDPESHYYLGVAHAGLGHDDQARKEWQAVKAGHPIHAAASLELARSLARAKDDAGALKAVEAALAVRPDVIRAGVVEVALLRKAGQAEKAQSELARFRGLDPTDPTLRYEQVKLGKDDPDLWQHLGADPERILNVADDYMSLGFYDEALALLSKKYPGPADIMATEPGSVSPQHHPLIAYYRAYCVAQTGGAAKKDLEEASGYLTEYVFPSRASSYPVLRFALKENPSDATALYLLGDLYMFSEDVDQAVASWQAARNQGFKRVELYRVLGRTLSELKKDPQGAAQAYQQGLKVAPGNADLQVGLQTLFGPKVSAEMLAAVAATPTPKTPAAAGSPKLTATSAKDPAKPTIMLPGPPSELSEALPTSPDGWAALALGLAAEGRTQEAGGIFIPEHFPAEKQNEFVRLAYIEVQVQGILALARSRQCPTALDAEERLGNEDTTLPFTFHGFGSSMKSLRIQYFLATFEATCGNEKGARKTWSKLEKASRDVTDPDFSIPFLAAAKIGPGAEPRIQAALDAVKAALAGPGEHYTLIYSRGMLLRAAGKEKDAEDSFVEALDAKAPPLIKYLALLALRQR